MNHKNKRSSSWRSTRAIAASTRCAILHRDGFVCSYCAVALPIKGAQLDHIKARKDGGKAIVTNLVTCCGKCNLARSHGQMDPLLVLVAIGKAWRPIDRAIGRELAREHYPSRMTRKAAA